MAPKPKHGIQSDHRLPHTIRVTIEELEAKVYLTAQRIMQELDAIEKKSGEGWVSAHQFSRLLTLGDDFCRACTAGVLSWRAKDKLGKPIPATYSAELIRRWRWQFLKLGLTPNVKKRWRIPDEQP